MTMGELMGLIQVFSDRVDGSFEGYEAQVRVPALTLPSFETHLTECIHHFF